MGGVKFPSSFDVTGRFPLDAKYWVDSFANLSDGEISVGLHRWTLDTGKEYVYQKTNVWKEAAGGEQGQAATVSIGKVIKGNIAKITNVGTSTNAILDVVLPKGDTGYTPAIDIGTVVTGTQPKVDNVGTSDRAILNFVLPTGKSGADGVIGKSVWIAYADNIQGLNPSRTSLNKNYISFLQDYVEPSLTSFTSWKLMNGTVGTNGVSTWIAYSPTSNGANATYTLNTQHKFISFLSSITQPLLTDFTTWVLFKGLDGGPAGDSAYQTWLSLGNSGTQAQFVASLAGSKGLSAYEIWLSVGNTGTQQDFINSLKGDGSTYNLLTASPTVKGGIKIGTGGIMAGDVFNVTSQIQDSLAPNSTTKGPSIRVINESLAGVLKNDSNYAKLDSFNTYTGSQKYGSPNSSAESFVANNGFSAANGPLGESSSYGTTHIELRSPSVTLFLQTVYDGIQFGLNQDSVDQSIFTGLNLAKSTGILTLPNVSHFKVPIPLEIDDATTKGYVDAADMVLQTNLNLFATNRANIVHQDQTRTYYTNHLDALAASVSGDTVIIPNNIVNLSNGGNAAQVNLPSGINVQTQGFDIGSTTTVGNGITLGGGTGKVLGGNSRVYSNSDGAWGIGSFTVDINLTYDIYNFTLINTGSTSAAISFFEGKEIHFYNCQIISLANIAFIIRNSTIVYFHNCTFNIKNTSVAGNFQNAASKAVFENCVIKVSNRSTTTSLLGSNSNSGIVQLINTSVIAESTTTNAITVNSLIIDGNSVIYGTVVSPSIVDNRVSAGSSAVSSVNGKTGAVVLSKSDLTLSNVDNTSDVAKPISNATQAALNNKANLVGGLVSANQLPIATKQQIVDGYDNTVLVSPYGLKQANISFGPDVFIGDWNPATNTPTLYPTIVGGGAGNVKGSYYRISNTISKAKRLVTADAAGAYVTINDVTNIYVGMYISGTGFRPGTYIQSINNKQLGLSDNVLSGQVLNGASVTINVSFAGFSTFILDDFIWWTGGTWLIRRFNSAVLNKTTSVVTFEKDAEYSLITSGTFTVDDSIKVVGVVATIYLDPAGTQPTIPTVGYRLISGSYVANKSLMYMFKVGANNQIQYTITDVS